MDDLESLFFSLDGGCSPFIPSATGTASHHNLMSPPPLQPTIRPRAVCRQPFPQLALLLSPLGPLISSPISLPGRYRLQDLVHYNLARPLTPNLQPTPPTTQPSTSSLRPATQPSTSSLQPATQPSTSLVSAQSAPADYSAFDQPITADYSAFN